MARDASRKGRGCVHGGRQAAAVHCGPAFAGVSRCPASRPPPTSCGRPILGRLTPGEPPGLETSSLSQTRLRRFQTTSPPARAERRALKSVDLVRATPQTAGLRSPPSQASPAFRLVTRALQSAAGFDGRCACELRSRRFHMGMDSSLRTVRLRNSSRLSKGGGSVFPVTRAANLSEYFLEIADGHVRCHMGASGNNSSKRGNS